MRIDPLMVIFQIWVPSLAVPNRLRQDIRSVGDDLRDRIDVTIGDRRLVLAVGELQFNAESGIHRPNCFQTILVWPSPKANRHAVRQPGNRLPRARRAQIQRVKVIDVL